MSQLEDQPTPGYSDALAAPQPAPRRLPASLAQTTAWLYRLVFILALMVIGVWLWLTPADLVQKADWIGYAICHRLPAHSLVIGGRQLPLCARCTGIYLGVTASLLTMTWLGRRRCAELPRPGLLAVLLVFIAVMGVDGLNSYLTLYPGMPHLYEPQNWLRLLSGMLHGIALASLVYPIFNQTVWADIEWTPALRNLSELALMMATGALGVGLTLLQLPALLYPLALIGGGGVLAMLTMINIVILVTLARRENRTRTWRQAAALLTVGLAAALVEVTALDLGRAYVTGLFGLPF